MSIEQQIKESIEKNFQLEHMELVNESHMHAGPAAESHFKLIMVSEHFTGLTKVRRQQAVYKVLAELMPQFHALGLHTYTPEEWQAVEKAPESPKCGGGH